MKKASLLLALFLASTCITALPSDVDAARLGGGRSFGSKSSMQQAAPAPRVQQQTTAQRQQMGQQTAPQKPGFLGGMGGILGGVLAGTLIGSLLSGAGFSGGGFLDILLLGLVAFLAFKFFSRRRAAESTPAMAAPGGMAAPQAPFEAPMQRQDTHDGWGRLNNGQGYAENVQQPVVPEGFDQEEFLRGAKAAYRRLQEAWDQRDIKDIEQFATPAVMQAIREQMAQDSTPSKTELMLINAHLLEVVHEGSVERAQVYFDVLLQETPEQQTPTSVREIWHFMREHSGSMWMLDGIQQVEG